MPLSYEEHFANLEREAELASRVRTSDANQFMQSANQAAEIIIKTEVSRAANAVAKQEATEKLDFLS